jgi:prepilin-type N-terminal cleavage/methylation domain-containing protein
MLLRPLHNDGGFTFIELLIAIVLVASALAGFAQLVNAAVRRAALVRDESLAQALAQSRLDLLRAAAWTYDVAGARNSAPELGESPPTALTEDQPGYFDELDLFGEVVAPTAGTVAYRRRWSIAAFGADPDTLLLRVCVWSVARSTAAWRDIPEACVSSLRTRQP